MKYLIEFYLFYLFCNFCFCAKIKKEETAGGSDARVHDHKLSDQDHYTDLDKDKKFEHNVDYDHEAFLGKDEADQFKRLTPEESKARLGKLVDKIDIDKNGNITEDELYQWLKNVSHKHILKDVESRWETIENNTSLEGYLEANYGALNYWSDEEKNEKKDLYDRYLKIMERDKKRFKAADQDGDGKLSKKEYADFLHPEDSHAMREIVIDETLEDLDKNHDGVVGIEEFIADIYPDGAAGGEEPGWVKVERDNFAQYRDKNKDGVLDREEIANWILPTDFDNTLNEAKHLIHEADQNSDGKLTKEEILEKYSVFVASQATSYGQAIYEKEDL